MRVGKLDQIIQLYSLTETNVDGELTQVYAPEGSPVFGEVLSQRGGEAFEAARTSARETIRVRLHFRPDVTNKWRLGWEGQVYNIINIDRSSRRAQGELWVTAEVLEAL